MFVLYCDICLSFYAVDQSAVCRFLLSASELSQCKSKQFSMCRKESI